jgi:adenylate kinase family enzyme
MAVTGLPLRFRPRRILVVGGGGSGKTVLALRLGTLLDLPVTHVDGLALDENHNHRGEQVLRPLLLKVAATDRWVIEGARPVVRPRLRERSDLVIFLDIPRPRRVWNWLARRVRYVGRHRPGMPPGWREPVGKKSFDLLWDYDRDIRDKVITACNALGPRQQCVWIRSYHDLEALVAAISPPPSLDGEERGATRPA